MPTLALLEASADADYSSELLIELNRVMRLLESPFTIRNGCKRRPRQKRTRHDGFNFASTWNVNKFALRLPQVYGANI